MADKKDDKGAGIREALKEEKKLEKLYKLRAEQQKSTLWADKELLKTTESQIAAGKEILKNPEIKSIYFGGR